MRIAYIVPRLVNQGPILVVQGIVENILDEDCIDIYYFDKEPHEIDFKCKTFQISFFEEFDFEKYDIIHSHMLRPDAYVWFHRKKIKSKCISTIHQDIKQNLKFSYNGFISIVFSQLWFHILKAQDVIVTLSNVMKENYSSTWNNKRLIPIYNGRHIDTSTEIDADDRDSIETLKKKYRIIGTVSLLSKTKGIDQLVELIAKQKDYALIVVGEGKEKGNLIKLSQELKVGDRCLFLGYRINGYRYIKHLDIFAMPSISEGFGLTLLEAAQFEKPIICSDIPIFKELFSANEVAFFKLFDINSLNEALRKAENTSSLLTMKAKEKYLNNYSDKAMAENYLSLYQSLLTK